ncbi:MAG: M6 family metalloprotease domain-containing protein [candidate division WOR-3 bacterium]|jgi:immune inhibitor A|nr:M6 family metalloprotease domain-containing protein [candidate division WOR-3 bacterium]MDH7519105.1 M6 family metalloprotease domain-containing protein [bacterium]
MRLLVLVTLLFGSLGAMPPMPGNTVKLRFPGQLEKPERVRALTDEPRRFLVLLVDFSDKPHQHSKGEFEQLLFGTGNLSMRDYFLEVSYGGLTMTGEVVDWVRLGNPYSYYLGDSFGIYGTFPRNSQGLVRDVVLAVDSRVDFSRYDGDGDGFVDGLMLIHAGAGAEETGSRQDIWSHKWQLSDPLFGSPGPVQTQDGVQVDVFSIQPERFQDGSLITIGVFCHEFGHILGLPDLYDTDYSSSGLGIFCLMAGGGWARVNESEPYGSSPVHICSWGKYLLGWVRPESIEKGGIDSLFASITATARQPVCFRILSNPGGVDWSGAGTGSGEYFLVENRQRIGFDRGLPGSGLLILHIDESQPSNDNERHPLVGILRADRSPSFALGPNDRGSDAQLWKASDTGVRNFTTPSTAFYDGVQSGVVIEKISPSGENMTALLRIAPLFLGRVYSFPNPVIPPKGNRQATIVYTPTDSARLANKYPQFKVKIYNIAGEPVRILDKETEINRTHRAAFWDLKNSRGKPVTSGMYFYVVELEDEGVKEEGIGKLTVIR